MLNILLHSNDRITNTINTIIKMPNNIQLSENLLAFTKSSHKYSLIIQFSCIRYIPNEDRDTGITIFFTILLSILQFKKIIKTETDKIKLKNESSFVTGILFKKEKTDDNLKIIYSKTNEKAKRSHLFKINFF